MNLKPEHKEYILNHDKDIRDGNWNEFFKSDEYPDGIGEPLCLANIPFMQALKRVPDSVFRSYEKLTSITIPDGVTSIGAWAFCNCTGLTSIIIPNSVTSISFSAFADCCNLASITIPKGVTNIGNRAFQNCSSLTSITIPNSVTSIGYLAFSGCNSLKSVTIPGHVKSIEWETFQNCNNLKSVTIPKSVTSIGDGAFSNIPTDLVITYKGTKEQWAQIYSNDAFEDTYFTVNCIDGQIVKRKK